MRKARKCYQVWAMTILVFMALAGGSAFPSTLVPQTWLPGDTLFNNPNVAFKAPLAIFGPGYNAALPRVDAVRHPLLKVTMKEVEQATIPTYPATRVWAYEISDAVTGKVLGPAHWPAVTVEAQRYLPTVLKYVNNLPSFGDPLIINKVPTTAIVQGLVSVDQSIHWADPLNNSGPMVCMNVDCTVPANAGSSCCQVFKGPVPAVAHLHGAEAFSGVDGGPEQWFTHGGLKGRDFFSYGYPGPGEAVYLYQNLQEPGTLWFHDHALGATRSNVYGGLAAFYFVRDHLKEPYNLPRGAYEIEMAIQDRQFDTNGQFFFPDGSPNGDPNNPVALCGDLSANDPCLNGPPPNPNIHKYWIPEFFGDVPIVNGDPWPIVNVEPRRYLFRVLDGSNARMYRLKFGGVLAGEPSPRVYIMGMDDNYLDKAVEVTNNKMATVGEVTPDGTLVPSQVFIGPGERNYVIVDFTGLAGKSVTLTNNAPAPFPTGTLIPGNPGQKGMAQIMRFNVTLPLVGVDTSCDPAKGQCVRPSPIVRLTDGSGNVAAGTKISKTRQIVLKENQGAGGPVEVFVNNTKWDGLMSPGIAPIFPGDGVSELPRVGSTELWEIINLTMDAHPMHTHLTQFQVLNRQSFNPAYGTDWAAAFPAATTYSPACTGGVYCAGYGPPLPYNIPNADGALGGNLPLANGAVNYLAGQAVVPPNPEEAGWKETAKAFPGMVTRLLVRWAPTSVSKALAAPGRNLYAFDPSRGPGYVWHCHIIDHEDNEMMRPYKVTK